MMRRIASWIRRAGADLDLVLENIGKHELTVTDGFWRWSKGGLSADVWHGAPVISTTDEQIVGILTIRDDHPTILPISATDLTGF